MAFQRVYNVSAGVPGVFFVNQPPPDVPSPPEPPPPPLPNLQTTIDPPIPLAPSQPPNPSTVVVQLPDDLVHQMTGDNTSWWLSALSGFGVGAVVAAVISAFVLYFLEKKRQNGENTRKQMELTRADQRRWDQEIRDAFSTVRGHLASLRTVVGNTRLAAHWSNNQDEMLKNYQQTITITNELAAIADSLRVVADDDLIEKFNAATQLAIAFLAQFSPVDGRVTYTVETVNSTKIPDYEAVEKDLLAAVKQAIKTPDDWKK